MTDKCLSKKLVHETFKYFIILGQIFGFFPVENICSSKVESLRFTWLSVKSISSIITCLLGISYVLILVRHVSLHGFDQFDIKTLVFNASGTMVCILFMRIARYWPRFIQKWSEVDETAYLYEIPNSYRKMVTLSVLLLVSQGTDNLMFEANSLWVAYECKHSIWEALEHYSVKMKFSQAFAVIPYSPWITVLLQILSTKMSFAWIYADLFIILISISLADRYRMISYKIQRMCKLKVNVECVWRNIRETYTSIKHLSTLTNKLIGHIVIVSFSTNAYFIIAQIFDSLREKESLIERVYFYSSFALLISRTLVLCHYCGSVYEEARKPLIILLTLPSMIYNTEIERLIESASQGSAITGLAFFSVSKGFLIKIASAIVTYELIMIRFNHEYLKVQSRDANC